MGFVLLRAVVLCGSYAFIVCLLLLGGMAGLGPALPGLLTDITHIYLLLQGFLSPLRESLR